MRLDLTQKVGMVSRNEKLKQMAVATPEVTTNVAEKVGVGGGSQGTVRDAARGGDEEDQKRRACTVTREDRVGAGAGVAAEIQGHANASEAEVFCLLQHALLCLGDFGSVKWGVIILVWFISCSKQCRSVFSSLQGSRSTRSDYPKSRMSSW